MTEPNPAYPKSLNNKVALVLGGAGGIGTVVSRMLAEAGATIVVTHRPNADAAEAAAALVAGLPGEGHSAYPSDITDTRSLIAVRDRITDRYGRLDILINAVGFTKPVPHAALELLDDELIDRMFQVNWRGAFAAVRTFAPLLKASGDGLVVSISSISAFTAVLDRVLRRQGRHRCDDQGTRPRAGARGPGAGGLAWRGRHRIRAGPRRRF
jgi:3-oxoacyl-[acyl-carrier protein] reductase